MYQRSALRSSVSRLTENWVPNKPSLLMLYLIDTAIQHPNSFKGSPRKIPTRSRFAHAIVSNTQENAMYKISNPNMNREVVLIFDPSASRSNPHTRQTLQPDTHPSAFSTALTPRNLLPRRSSSDRVRAALRNGVRPVGVALPSHSAAAGHLDELVLELGASGELDRGSPERVAGGVLRGRQGNTGRSAPAAKLRDRANKLDGLAVAGADLVVEGHSDGGDGGARGTGGLGGGDKSRGGGSGLGRGRLGLAAAAADNGNVSAREVNLRGLERVPAEREQGVAGDVVGDLDLLGDRVTASNGGEARAERSVVDALAATAAVGLEFVAS